MRPTPSSEHDERDREIIRLLIGLRAFESAYPPELLSARRAAFLAQVERLDSIELDEGLADEDQQIVHLLGNLRSAEAEYPPDLLTARRSALLQRMERVEAPSLWDALRLSIQRFFRDRTATRTVPLPGLLRTSLVIGSLAAAVFLGSLFFSRAEPSFQPSASQGAAAPTHFLTAGAGDTAIVICTPEDQTPSCPPGDLDPGQDLADQRNGAARPAVSKDERSNPDGVYKAAYVNDGRGGASWVSNSPDSWIKIDLGKVTTINTVSLLKGSADPSSEDNPGQFVIAVALSDVYADGDSSDDYREYAQIFRSEEMGFSGTVSQSETIRTQFPPVRARFIKITFEKAGTAIEEVSVFMVQPPVLAERPTRRPQDDLSGINLTAVHTSTAALMNTVTSVPTGTRLATGTAVPTLTATPSNTPTPLPTNTLAPADTATPVPTDPPPTVVPPTAIPPTIQPSPVSTDPIVVTGNDQTLIFTCNGNAAEIRGHTNTVTLLGSCSSITVTGNGNNVFWQSGSPVITDRGSDNIIRQL